MTFVEVINDAAENVARLTKQYRAAIEMDFYMVAAALFSLCPEIASVRWNQYIPNTGVGFTIGTIEYAERTPDQSDDRPPVDPLSHWEARAMFTGYINSLALFLQQQYGHRVWVTVHRNGVTVTDMR